MHLLYRNVNEAFIDLVRIFRDRDDQEVNIVARPSRVGQVLQIAEPVIVTYTHPRERVLFNAARDCNPFFHLYESLWMLAGRNDIAPLNYYSSNYAAQVQDGDLPYANGAYGYRWRRAGRDDFIDQLGELVMHLSRNHDSRRAVLQMWNVDDDLMKVDKSKDVCCNTHAYFLINDSRLDMTVCNRSNDLIWGMLGANVVHFSFLQEYMAAAIGVEVGVYSQMTNNLHVYTERFEPEKWLTAERDCPVKGYSPLSLVKDQAAFDKLLPEFVERHSKSGLAGNYESEPFLDRVAQPMCLAFHYYKKREWDAAFYTAGTILADDWRIAATEWIKRRSKRATGAL